MNEETIKIADKVLLRTNSDWKTNASILKECKSIGLTESNIRIALAYLKDKGFLEIREVNGFDQYRRTTKAIQLRLEKRKFSDWYKEEEVKKQNQLEKIERDEEIKELQRRDLRDKVEKMNKEQMEFWTSQRQRNKHLTILAIISAVFSLIALFKSFGFF